MAGLGIGPADFAIFDLRDPDARADAIDGTLGPKLQRIGQLVASGLSRVAGEELGVAPVKAARKKGAPPGEAVVVFSAAVERGWQRGAFLAIGASREHLHARVGARPTADRDGAMRRTLAREAANLAKKGKPFRKLRAFSDWDGEELPELAPAHSSAFWEELAEELAPARPGVDVGVAWTAEEARSLAVGDLLGVFRDLAPLYKLLAGACAPPRPAPEHRSPRP